MAGKKRSTSSPNPNPNPIFIGNCKVKIDGKGYSCASIAEGLLISVPKGPKIKISGGKRLPLDDCSFVLLNPKNGDSNTKTLLQEVLKIYMEQLPAMNYAANTGKESHFIEKCIYSGKYKTLILESNCSDGHGKVIAAISYQIIPTDMQYAEVPLAAVCSNYQNKGIGHLMYMELKERLEGVGISTLLCWGDMESEGFWFKQGFTSIGEVDCKGKARRLPIKANIRKALCFPGCSSLMIAHLKYNVAPPLYSTHAKLCSSAKAHAKSLSCVPTVIAGPMETWENSGKISSSEPVIKAHPVYDQDNQVESTQSHYFGKDGCSIDARKVNVFCTYGSCSRDGDDPDLPEGNECKCNNDINKGLSGKRVKKRVWESSLSSLKSKRIRGCHCIVDSKDHKDVESAYAKTTDAAMENISFGTLMGKTSIDNICNDPSIHAEGRSPDNMNLVLVPRENCPRIMFMNITDDAKKSSLTKIVEELGGSVTCDGRSSTHVITGKARRTLNFCTALCSGAWIVSSHWLKASFKKGKFLGECSFILEDEDYLLKYKSELKDVVVRARSSPNSLLKGYDICLAKHIQPSKDVLLSIIKAGGGNVILRLKDVKEPSMTIFLACDEDMEDAIIAARKGLWTFSSDWLMNCVMKQELNMEAPQFAESL